ncbi:ABC transporter permease [Oceanobacillus timonensis]|uniref:ABC transporter permease n=1 Tax=Oceanobacillus timonensis TaxID=1926285 RepID=UPI0009BAC00F|nr:ABC transporter permease [Oceanobacillus timonensis]
MINYLKSENYRILHKKSLYLTTAVCFFLIIGAAFSLNYFSRVDADFRYGTSSFFYSNVIGMGTQIIIISYLYNAILTAKDIALTKQAVSFGISRSVIFWSKLLVTLSYFLLVCAAGLLLMIGLGQSLFAEDQGVVSNFFLASFNMLPIVLSGFILIHALKMLKIADIYNIIIVVFIYVFSDDVLRFIFRQVNGLNELYTFAPGALLTDNLMHFMNQSVQLDDRYWVTGAVISVIALLIGAGRFTKQDMD